MGCGMSELIAPGYILALQNASLKKSGVLRDNIKYFSIYFVYTKYVIY